MEHALDNDNNEIYWKIAIEKSSYAEKKNSLIPLETQIIKTYDYNFSKFELRKLSCNRPLSILKNKPKKNPFLPWNKDLELSKIGLKHILILNKYPVQIGHMLLITKEWAPQNGWLSIEDWNALEIVDKDTPGLWFFNSSPESGASQPHRHLQLLRRRNIQSYCPRDTWFINLLNKQYTNEDKIYNSTYVARRNEEDNAYELYYKYINACKCLKLGSPDTHSKPASPYNLLLGKNWLSVIRRSKDGTNGFNINALGFAGYLLATEISDISWLNVVGPEFLLGQLVDPKK